MDANIDAASFNHPCRPPPPRAPQPTSSPVPRLPFRNSDPQVPLPSLLNNLGRNKIKEAG